MKGSGTAKKKGSLISTASSVPPKTLGSVSKSPGSPVLDCSVVLNLEVNFWNKNHTLGPPGSWNLNTHNRISFPTKPFGFGYPECNIVDDQFLLGSSVFLSQGQLSPLLVSEGQERGKKRTWGEWGTKAGSRKICPCLMVTVFGRPFSNMGRDMSPRTIKKSSLPFVGLCEKWSYLSVLNVVINPWIRPPNKHDFEEGGWGLAKHELGTDRRMETLLVLFNPTRKDIVGWFHAWLFFHSPSMLKLPSARIFHTTKFLRTFSQQKRALMFPGQGTQYPGMCKVGLSNEFSFRRI